MWLQSLKKDVGRDLEQRVGNKEDCQRQVVLRSRKMKVRFKLPSDPILRNGLYSLKLCIPDIGPVEEG
jgi:ribosomal protein RSM22 (predicted rRNA methylase)